MVIFSFCQPYSSRLWRNRAQQMALTENEMARVMANPQLLCSSPLITFMPYSEAMKVPDCMMMVTEVRVRIVLFVLLLMMLE